MKLIVGLGNPGDKYEKTRHNIGFNVLEKFLKDFESSKETFWEDDNKLKSYLVKIEWQPKKGKSDEVILAKPKTYMNDSGRAVSLASVFYKIEPSNIWIVYDDVDLPLGSLKIRFGGGTAGHRGVTSIMEKLGTDKFWRFRLGIGHPRLNTRGKSVKIKYRGVDKFVLDTFEKTEFGKVGELIKRTSKALQEALEKGMESAMNRYNSK